MSAVSGLKAFDDILLGHMEKKEMAGASYVVARGGETIFENCVGFSDIAAGKKLEFDTIMRLASMTKPLTGAAVMKARELGLLGLGDPVSKYIPEFSSLSVAEFDAGGNITGTHPTDSEIYIRDLLNHTSGIGMSAATQKIFGSAFPGITLADLVPKYASVPLDFEPRTASAYSATMSFDIACRIVEIVSGMEYEAFLKKHILAPLGMCDTAYALSPLQEKRLAVMYHCENGKIVPSRPDQLILSNVTPTFKAGGTQLFSTILDYSRFAAMLCGGGEYGGARILSPESVKLMASSSLPEALRGKGREEWGLSVRVITRKEPPDQALNPGAFGWSGAYETHFFIDPGLSLYAVLFKNVTSGLGAGAVTSREFEREVMNAVESR